MSRNSGVANTIVLVAPPFCNPNETDGISMVEPGHCETVPVPSYASVRNALLGESFFGAEDPKQSTEDTQKKMTELEERPISIVPSKGTSDAPGGFDICREYGYKYEYPQDQQEGEAGEEDDEEEDDDDDSNNHQVGCGSMEQPLHIASATNKKMIAIGNMPTKTSEDLPYVSLLGRIYHPIHEYEARKQDEKSLFWFTYRCDFPEIRPYGITTDAGWGCMLRSAQMLLAQTLRIHFKNRQWRPPSSIQRRRQDPMYHNMLTWFADFPSPKESIYSLHNMVATGLAKYQTLPGEWYGPGTACYVLRDLVALHEQSQPDLFRVHVASEGTVYREALYKLMTRDAVRRAEQRKMEKGKTEEQPTPLHPLDPSIPTTPSTYETMKQYDWDTGLLLLVPLRLGLNNFNQDYVHCLAASFALPQSVGVLGGRPRGARWFFGAYLDGSKVLGLDPHTVQTAPARRPVFGPPSNQPSKQTSIVDLSDDYIRSVHTAYPEIYPIAKMDPSIALGFYCRDKVEYEQLEQSFQQFKVQPATRNCPDLFAFADKVPDYLSSTMKEMILMDASDALGEDDLNEGDNASQESDEDEYVLL